MIFEVRVVPNAKKVSVAEWGGKYFVHLTSRAEGGKANKELIEVLADHLEVRKTAVRIIRGTKSREKVVEVRK